MTKRAVLYGRVSRDDSRAEGRNLEGQIAMGEEFANNRGYHIVARLCEDDKGASGADINLPKLNEIREMAQNSQFDVLIVREIDRLSRSLAKQLIVEQELKRHGVV
ncbi:MAG: recombinase family protein, partial [Nitrospira sp.]|nr:recombinase family protein [Nitrospira sp.]